MWGEFQDGTWGHGGSPGTGLGKHQAGHRGRAGMGLSWGHKESLGWDWRNTEMNTGMGQGQHQDGV